MTDDRVRRCATIEKNFLLSIRFGIVDAFPYKATDGSSFRNSGWAWGIWCDIHLTLR